jgi:hypothetical protein
MNQDVERACRKLAGFERPRVQRTVDDEDDNGDEDSDQIFMVPALLR